MWGLLPPSGTHADTEAGRQAASAQRRTVRGSELWPARPTLESLCLTSGTLRVLTPWYQQELSSALPDSALPKKSTHCEPKATSLPSGSCFPIFSMVKFLFEKHGRFHCQLCKPQGSQLAFFTLEKGTAGKDGAQNFQRSPWGPEQPPSTSCPSTRLGLAWPGLFPGPPVKALGNAATATPAQGWLLICRL